MQSKELGAYMQVIQGVQIDIFAVKKKEGERIRGKYQGEEKQRRVWTDGRTDRNRRFCKRSSQS